MKLLHSHEPNAGFILLEVIVSFGIVTMLLWAFASVLFQSRNISGNNLKELRALMYNRELAEVAKDLEQSNWDQLTDPSCASPATCYPAISDNAWVLKPGKETIGDYTRTISVTPVFRNTASFPNAIVPTGVADNNTKKITTTVGWLNGKINKTTTLVIYVHKLP